MQSRLERSLFEFNRQPTGVLESETDRMSLEVLIVSRGLSHPEPWAVRYSTYANASSSSETQEMVRKLLMHPPDVFISPVVAVYFLKNEPE